jgi:hypothetical protein
MADNYTVNPFKTKMRVTLTKRKITGVGRMAGVVAIGIAKYGLFK